MSIFSKIAHGIKDLFTHPEKADAALTKAAQLVDRALPIVKVIASITPDKRDDEIVAAFDHYAVPFDAVMLQAPKEKHGLLLLDLATTVLQRELPSTATNILQTAISMAVTGSKAA